MDPSNFNERMNLNSIPKPDLWQLHFYHYYQMFLQYFSLMDEMRLQSEWQQFHFRQQQLQQQQQQQQQLQEQKPELSERNEFFKSKYRSKSCEIPIGRISSSPDRLSSRSSSSSSMSSMKKRRIVTNDGSPTRERILISVWNPKLETNKQIDHKDDNDDVEVDDDDDDYRNKKRKKFQSFRSRNRGKKRH